MPYLESFLKDSLLYIFFQHEHICRILKCFIHIFILFKESLYIKDEEMSSVFRGHIVNEDRRENIAYI